MFEHLLDLFLKEKDFLTEKEIIIPVLAEKLIAAMQNTPSGKIAIGFSGGVDSALLALLAEKTGKKFQLYTIGLAGAKDLDPAVQLALERKWQIKVKLLSQQEAEEIVQETYEILKESDAELSVTHLGIAAVVYTILKMAKQDNIQTVLGGLGAEEIFAGYMRHCDYGKNFSPEFMQQAMVDGLAGMETRDLARDIPLTEYFAVDLVAPFLDEDLVKYAMKIHPSLKMNQEQKKIILRDVAKSFGLPEVPAERKKLAAQYGSGFDKVVKHLVKEGTITLPTGKAAEE